MLSYASTATRCGSMRGIQSISDAPAQNSLGAPAFLAA